MPTCTISYSTMQGRVSGFAWLWARSEKGRERRWAGGSDEIMEVRVVCDFCFSGGGWVVFKAKKHPSRRSKCVPAAAPVSAVETIFRAS